jgi:hypothetical protein
LADGVDAAVKGMQPAERDPVLDGPRAEPELDQLRPVHDAVLPLRQPANRPLNLTKPSFPSHIGGKLGLVGHAAQGGAPRVTGG